MASKSAKTEETPPKKEEQNLLHHSRVYALADKYNIPSLKALAVENFRADCFWFWGDDDFPKAAREIYETTPDQDRGLRDAMVDTVYKHLSLLTKPEMKLTVRDSLLAYDLLYKLAV